MRIAATILLLSVVVASLSACEAPQNQTNGEETGDTTQVRLIQVWSLDEGFDRPESALYDSQRDVIYVSNIVGGPAEQDGTGYISKVSPDGSMVEQEWVSGLDAPKGMALAGGTLYVSNLDELIAIDPETGEITNRFPAENATFLNDVAAGQGRTVYVTDSNTGLIYRLQGDSLSVWLDDPAIQAPNGIHMVDGTIVVAAADSTAENPGDARYLRTISIDGSEIGALEPSDPLGALDAVEPDGHGGFFISDWSGATVSHFMPGDTVTTLVEVSQGTADLEYVPESQRMYLPVMMADRLIAYDVSWDGSDI